MKTLIINIILIIMANQVNAQKIVYDKENKHKSYHKEFQNIIFNDSQIKFPQKAVGDSAKAKEAAAALSAVVPGAIELGYKLITNLVENRLKKFSGEYTIQKSYLNAGKSLIPEFVFERKVSVKNKTVLESALKVVFKGQEIAGFSGFVYYIESITLNYSKAKTVDKDELFDYIFEIKPIIYVNGEKKSQELYPITVHSVGFGPNPLLSEDSWKLEHRTDIIPLPRGAILSEISLKIVEVNPKKIRNERILEALNKYGEDVTKIINNYIEAKKSDDVEN